MSSRYYAQTGIGFLVDKELIQAMIDNFKTGNVSNQDLLDSLYQSIDIEDVNDPDLDYNDILTEMYYNDDINFLESYEDYASYFLYDVKNDYFDFSKDFKEDFHYLPLSYHISLFRPLFKSVDELKEEIYRCFPALPKDYNWKNKIIYYTGVVFG